MTAILTPFFIGETRLEWGWTCDTCEKQRAGMTQPHAQNSLARHNRENHPETVYQVGLLGALIAAAEDDLNLAVQEAQDKGWPTRMAEDRLNTLLDAWMTLTGLPANQRGAAIPLARMAAQEGTVAHVAPF